MKKEKLEQFAQQLEKVKEKANEGARDKVMPFIKGNEGVVVIVLAVMLLVSLSVKMVLLGGVVVAVLMLPSYLPKILAKLEKKAEPKVEEPKAVETSVTDEKKE